MAEVDLRAAGSTVAGEEYPMLESLHARGVGPIPELDVAFGPRLNVFAGDNGLGKTFLLELAWHAVTRSWTNDPLMPSPGVHAELDWSAKTSGANSAEFKPHAQGWREYGSDVEPALVLHALVDGGFAIWDARRHRTWSAKGYPTSSAPWRFSTAAIWDGLTQDGKTVSNGLIRDWVSWQRQRGDLDCFDLLTRALARLSPRGEPLVPGKPRRVWLDDARDIPTLDLPWGNVPVVFASAGMKRILALAYLIVWAWHEHREAARLVGEPPTRQVVLLFDEVESHLHPQWQRRILPALLDVLTGLGDGLDVQIFATTHAPLVLASVEPVVEPERDRLFHFELNSTGEVSLHERPWRKGDVLSYLVGDLFGMDQARSVEAEQAIGAAEAWMRGERDGLPHGLASLDEIDAALTGALPDLDPFWPRWVVHGRRAIQ